MERLPKTYIFEVSASYGDNYCKNALFEIIKATNNMSRWKINTYYNPIHCEYVIEVQEDLWKG